MKLLITGSRNPTQRMLNCAERLLGFALAEGYEIIVGDADGVDWHVIKMVDLICGREAKISVYGGYGKMRHRTLHGTNVPTKLTYPGRDWLMARECDGCFAIWDGKSHGTQITFKAAHGLKKPTLIWDDHD